MEFYGKYKQNIQIAVMVTLAAVSLYKIQDAISLESYPAGGYDEQMWTGASIVSYKMFFEDYQRKNFVPERWFRGYSQKYNYNFSKLSASELQWFSDDVWTFGWKAPNIAKFIMGFAVVNFGGDVNPEGYFHQYTPDKEKNHWPGNYAPENFVRLARTANAVLTFGSLAMLLLIGWKFFNFWTGAVSLIFVLFGKSFLRVSIAAGVDGASIFFTTLTIFLAGLFIRNLYEKNNRKTLLKYAALVGLSFPLAVGSKLSAALNGYVFLIFIIAVLYLLFKSTGAKNFKKPRELSAAIKERNELLKTLALSAAIIGALTYIIFIYTNPVFYDEPLLKVKMIRESVKEFFDIRANALGTNEMNESWLVSLWQIFKLNLIRMSDRYFAFLGYIIPLKFNFLDGLFVGFGFWLVLKKGIASAKSSLKLNFEIYLVIWTLVYMWGISDFIWTDFPRYFMPLYPAFALLFGLGIVNAGRLITEKIINRKVLS